MSDRGFTYMELLIVLAIAGVIISFSMVMGMGSVARSSVIEERDLFVSLLLTGARAEAIANVNQKAHGIHIDNPGHTYVLFEGTAFSSSSPSNRSTPFTNSTLSITAFPTTTNIIFEQLSGDVISGTGTITIAGPGVDTKITLNDVGQIDW
jgi:prepilin-type N-terminal cleavage/methylation domain-containing protein